MLRINMLSGIRRRWMTNTMAVVIVVVLLGMSAFSVFAATYYYNGMRTSLETKAKTATDFFDSYINNSYEEFYQSASLYTASFDERDKLELQFLNANGTVLTSTYGLSAWTSPKTEDIISAIDTKKISVWTGENPNTGERIMAVSSPMVYSDGRVIGVMRYVTSLRLVDRQILIICLIMFAAGIFIILLIMTMNMFFISSIVDPITEINDMAKRISEGGYGIQIGKQYNDEIGELTDTINDMSMKIGQAEKVQSEFISSVSHELRTPLTAITGWAETIRYDEAMSEDSKLGVRIILNETRRLAQMVEELLEFTRIQDGHFSLRIVKMNIEDALEESIFTYREILRQNDIMLIYEPPEEELPQIDGDPERLRQVFLNILDNAAKYGKDGKRILASLEREGDEAVISIRDFGPGIPEEELPHVKLKFYKGSTKERGSGIGLAVCDEIAKLHRGTLVIANAEGGGTMVSLRLPLPTEEQL